MKDKRTYTNIKEYNEEMTYENEVKISHDDRGSGDLTFQIEQLTKQKEFLQDKCRQAGETIDGLRKELDRLSEENGNLMTLLGDKNVKG
jgi:predicted RNase H-like nuclease (RuvC/YqgF family)|tara:strand:- start:375 stop:641 length:267 start_codon:yes stop_codon:yes gene_type:complete